ncbi:hypothetical protein SH1V18_32250 [Vallitalea longa]|uniref:Uncharacterized protein n=1 Tax=Vallitalea longa TaxID=2936439 RepID=A0A9W5YB55_9FIRM|nr:DUF6709 family protein [Vallitalea longa]GKX30745.1 hypothetical protein SH1V18_32250 [Vallitalea longa]
METPQFIKIYKKRKRIGILILAILLISEVILFDRCITSYDNNTNDPTIINNFEELNNAMVNNDYVHLEISEYYDLGSVATERNGSKISETYYIGYGINKKMLVISLKEDEYYEFVRDTNDSYILKGTFGKINSNLRGTLEELCEDVATPEELHEIMYDYFLSCETPLDALTSKLIIMFFAFLMICVCIYILCKNSRSLRKLKKEHGSDFDMFCEKVDSEMKATTVLRKGAITVTQNYIIANSPCTFFVLPKDELMWVYKGVTRYYRIIKRTNITFVFANKTKYQITSINNKNIDDLIEHFSQDSYKCIVGYSDELDKMYRKQTDAFIQQWNNKYNINDIQ